MSCDCEKCGRHHDMLICLLLHRIEFTVTECNEYRTESSARGHGANLQLKSWVCCETYHGHGLHTGLLSVCVKHLLGCVESKTAERWSRDKEVRASSRFISWVSCFGDSVPRDRSRDGAVHGIKVAGSRYGMSRGCPDSDVPCPRSQA